MYFTIKNSVVRLSPEGIFCVCFLALLQLAESRDYNMYLLINIKLVE